MAKVQLTESQLTKIVEQATREALRKINEGAGWDTFKSAFKVGRQEPDSTVNYKDTINQGEDMGYDNWVANKKEYDATRNADDVMGRRLDRAQRRVNNGASPEDAGLDTATSNKKTSAINRDASAIDTVMSRPGVLGKAQRAAAVGAHIAGRGVGKVQNGVNNFIHNDLGIQTKE